MALLNDISRKFICSSFCLIGLVCVTGLCDGGTPDSGVGGGESRRVSKKQRPHGSSDPVG